MCRVFDLVSRKDVHTRDNFILEITEMLRLSLQRSRMGLVALRRLGCVIPSHC